MKNKNYQFVFLYAIGSILIVAGHCNNGSINLAFDFFDIYTFHLALFIFASGYFYKEKYESNPLKYIWKKFKKLIIPMYMVNLFFGIFILILKRYGFSIGAEFNLYNLLIAPLRDGHQFVYNMCFWFVVPLFMVESFNILFRKINRKSLYQEYFNTLLYFILGIGALCFARYGSNIQNHLFFLRFLYFLPYYQLGILYHKKLERHDTLCNEKYFIVLLIIQFILITMNKGLPSYSPSWMQFNGQIFLPYLEAILGVAFWLRVAKIMEEYTKKSKVINCVADHAYSIMAYQFLGFFFVKSLFALFSKYTPCFSNFDFVAFKSNVWYYYLPFNINQWLIVYLIFGIATPILINNIIVYCKKKITILLPYNIEKNVDNK